jgi:acetyl esterase/lipase
MFKGFPPPMMDTSHVKRKWLDLPYAHQSPTQKLDIYLPEKGDGPFPVIFVIHGGAWIKRGCPKCAHVERAGSRICGDLH